MRPRRWTFALVLIAAACHSPTAVRAYEEHVGDLPNLTLPTLGGSQLWSDVAWQDGWRVQQHAWTGHHRLLDPGNRRRAWGSWERCQSALWEVDGSQDARTHLVVLLHGLGRTRRSLTGLEEALAAAGHRVACLSYPSTRAAIEQHAAAVTAVLDGLEGVERVSFVTHSLGGIVAREVLSDPSAAWRKRIQPGILIQLAPPNQGAEIARRLDLWPVRWLLGPSFVALANPRGLPGIPTFVITGAGRANPWVAGLDDGVVGIGEVYLPGARTEYVPGAWHTLVMDHQVVRERVLALLEPID